MSPSASKTKQGSDKGVTPASECGSRLQLIIDLFYDGKVALFANDMGVDVGAVYPYLRGTRELGGTWLIRLASRGINTHWVTTDEGSMFAPSDAGRRLERQVVGLALRAKRELDTPASNITLLPTDNLDKQRVHSLGELADLLQPTKAAKDRKRSRPK